MVSNRSNSSSVSGLDSLSYLNTNEVSQVLFVKANRAPTGNDKKFRISTLWLDESNNHVYSLVKVQGTAIWSILSAGTGDLDSLTGDSGGAIAPIAGNIDIVGSGDITVVGNPSTSTLTITDSSNPDIETITGDSGGAVGPSSGNITLVGADGISIAGNPATNSLTISGAGTKEFPITPYVVGPAGQAGYLTIQSAVDAANAAGGGMVFVQKGTYTENLTLYDAIQIFGDSEQGTFITGTHTPPSSGTLNINRCTLKSATDIFNSAAAGTTTIIIEDCTVNVINGYTFNLPNWTGSVQSFNIGNFGTNDGYFNNTAGASLYVFSAGIGNGTTNTLTVSGDVIFAGAVDCGCPLSIQGSATFKSIGSYYDNTITISGSATAEFNADTISSGATAAITHNSTGEVSLSNLTINSSNSPAIDGTGSGIITMASTTFLNNGEWNSALTVNGAPVVILGNNLAGGTLSVGHGNNPEIDLDFSINGANLNGILSVDTSATTDLLGVVEHRHSDTAGFGAHHISLRSRGTHASPTLVQNNDLLSQTVNAGYDGSTFSLSSSINAYVDGAPGASSMPGRLVFSTSPTGSQTPVERLRISQDGVIKFNQAYSFPTSDGTIGQTLVTDGGGNISWSSTGTGTTINVQTFTTSGTYTPTSGMEYCVIEVVGAGGGGQGVHAQANSAWAGAGGGGGGYSRGVFDAATIGASQTVTIGTGGAGGTVPGVAGSESTGSNGGTTSVGTLIQATGGNAGTKTSGISTGGAGGIGSLGQVNSKGAGGGAGLHLPSAVTGVYGYGGYGGGSALGGGAAGYSIVSGTVVTHSHTGDNGSEYGGGGSSGVASNSASVAGGSGADGVVIITEYI